MNACEDPLLRHSVYSHAVVPREQPPRPNKPAEPGPRPPTWQMFWAWGLVQGAASVVLFFVVRSGLPSWEMQVGVVADGDSWIRHHNFVIACIAATLPWLFPRKRN
jgi:hypothetical protein